MENTGLFEQNKIHIKSVFFHFLTKRPNGRHTYLNSHNTVLHDTNRLNISDSRAGSIWKTVGFKATLCAKFFFSCHLCKYPQYKFY